MFGQVVGDLGYLEVGCNLVSGYTPDGDPH